MAIKLKSKPKYPSQFDSFTYIPPKANESKAITARELIERTDLNLEWTVEGLIANGLVSLLSAHPKVGKTTLLYHLFESVLNKSDFLGRALSFDGNIFLLTEEPYPILKSKLSDLELGTERISILQKSLVKSWNESIEEIEHHIVMKNAKLIIVDTLAAFWSVRDENSAASITGPYQLFQQLIQRYNVAGVLIHHLRKSGGDDGEGVRGSNAILAAVDVTIEMVRDGETKRRISVQSRYSQVAKDEFVIELKDGKYNYLGAKEEFSSESVKNRVREFFASNGSMQFKPEQVCDGINPKPSLSTVRKVLEGLYHEKAIQRIGKGSKGDPWKYYLPKTVSRKGPRTTALG